MRLKIDFPKSLDEVDEWVDEKFPNLSENDRLHMIHLARVRILEDMIDEASGQNQLRREIQAKQKHGKGMVK